MKIYRITALAAVATFICIAIYLLSLFVVRDVPISISYDVTESPDLISALFQEISMVAAVLEMKAGKNESTRDTQRMHWQKKNDSQGISWDLVDSGQAHISIYSTAAGSDGDLLKLVALIQEKIPTQPEKVTSQLQLAPGRFGACASLQRPEIKDSTCIYKRPGVLDISELRRLLQSHPSK
ncbi:hypothetical protein [Variovorax sp. 350MFTsu5.1]|uniref:hypothetical protein n=1 Tax=Variovorax sp. 350MFTsu5.1 TaxID=3158365 RepID=UPI003AB06E85